MEKRALNKLLTVVLSVFLIILVITFSIGLPIYFRPFYYMQIESLGVEADTWHTKEEIKEAYDLLLDYLTIPNREFSTGVFQYSESGKSHFEDCKRLFNLNLTLFIISLIVVITIYILHKKKKITICRPCGYNFMLACGVGALIFFVFLIGLCSIDFDTAFLVFHRIFFPGKDNFYFDPYTDGIILILPLKFFERCAILIGSVILLSLLGFIIYAVIEKKKVSKN